MLELIFLTSNIVKLAHARYIVGHRPIAIVGFRERTYHASYYEPRISSRSELLERSYRNALQQCHKAGISSQLHFFFLEDTSVRIEALSTTDEDFPGLDIKYWMEEMTFMELDNELRIRGNRRQVAVRSDVVLHIPDRYRWELSDMREYLTFTGTQEGYIVDAELTYNSNMLFPWLDNRTFNKWFCPDGYDVPMGSLDIGSADKVDFRRKSIEQMIEVLSTGNLVWSAPVQMTLPLALERNFILYGYTCAGKTTASQHLALKFGYLHVEASDFMYWQYYLRHGFHENVAIGSFAEQALSEIPNIVADKVAEYVVEEERSPVVVSGFRSILEMKCLLKSLDYTGRRFEVIFISAPAHERFQRMEVRSREHDGLSFEQFLEKDVQQHRMGLGNVECTEWVQSWSNEGSLEDYLRFVETVISTKGGDVVAVEEAIRRLGALIDVKLEDAILVALLSVWRMDESRPYLSRLRLQHA